jgi:hypothetical protein
MKKGFLLGITSILLTFVIAGCPVDPLSSDASISGIQVAGVTASLGLPSDNWRAVEPGHVYLSEEQLTGAEISVSKGDGVVTYYSKPIGDFAPDFVENNIFDLAHGDIVFVEAFSPNQDNYLLYAVQIHQRTPKLADIALAGRSIETSGVWGNPNADLSSVTEGQLWFGTSQRSTNLALALTPEVPGVVIRTAKAAGAADPIFDIAGPAPVVPLVTNGEFLYVEITDSESFVPGVLYYKFRLVEKNDAATLSSATVNSENVIIGPAGTTYNVTTATSGETLLFNPAPANLAVSGVPAEGASIQFGWSKYATDLQNSIVYTGTNNSTTLGKFTGLTYISAKVAAAVGDVRYYVWTTYSGNPEARVASVTINGSPTTLPAGATAWNAANVAAKIQVANLDTLTITTAGESPNATVSYASGTSDTAAPAAANWKSGGGFTNLSIGNYIGIRVVSEDTRTTYYYKFQVGVGSSDAVITGATINSGTVTLPTADPVWADAVEAVVAVDSLNITITVTGESPNATVSYASGTSATTVPAAANWNTTGVLSLAADNSYIGIRVVSQNGVVTNYYKFRIDPAGTETDATVTSTTINGSPVSLPTGAAAWNTATASVVLGSAAGLANFTVGATGASTGATVSYGTSTVNTTLPTNWNAAGTFTNLANGTYVGVRVISGNHATTYYYKFRIINSGATVASATINGVSAPLPTGDTAWNAANMANVVLTNLNSLTIAVAGASPNATVSYASGTSDTAVPAAANWNTTGVFSNLAVGSYIGIRVVSEDTLATYYYKFRVYPTNANEASIDRILFNAIQVPLTTPALTHAAAVATPYTATGNITVVARGVPPLATVTWGIRNDDATEPTYGTGTLTVPVGTSYITIRVVPAVGTDNTKYYKYQITR